MPRAIECKYHGPTDRKGSRYSAYDHGTGKRVTVAASYESDMQGECWRAARLLIAKMGWQHITNWAGAATRDGIVFVPAAGHGRYHTLTESDMTAA